MKKYLISLLTLWGFILLGNQEFVFIITSFNNALWYKRNLDTLLSQSYSNWIAYYIDDCSDDETSELVQAYIKEKKLDHKIFYHRNTERKYKMYNVFSSIQKSPDNAIIFIYDGDDWLAHGHVLIKILKEYKEKQIWITYGSYLDEPGERHASALPSHAIAENLFRFPPFVFNIVPGHPLTFYAWLFKKIKYEDFIINNIPFPAAGSDMIFIPPLFEMAGNRFAYIPDILYIHNCLTPLADAKVNPTSQSMVSITCTKKERYYPLSD